MAAELEELIVGALSGDDDAISKLSAKTKSSEIQELRDNAGHFDTLFDALDEVISKSEAVSRLCIDLAEKDVLDSQTFRNALNSAVKCLLPPYISSQTVLKAVGARDSEVQASEVSARLKKLQKIKSGCLVYQSDSKIWGKVTSIDKGTATLGINSLSAGNLLSLPISSALGNASFFDANPEMFNILVPDRHRLPSAQKFKEIFTHNALTELSETRLKEIIPYPAGSLGRHQTGRGGNRQAGKAFRSPPCADVAERRHHARRLHCHACGGKSRAAPHGYVPSSPRQSALLARRCENSGDRQGTRGMGTHLHETAPLLHQGIQSPLHR